MKTKTLYKELKAEFYRKNKLLFVIAAIASLCAGTVGLAFSWVLRALLDTAAGSEGSLPFMKVLMIVGIILVLSVSFSVTDYLSRPAFIKKAMIQYKNFAFEKLTNKNISSFRNENTAAYISALTNDATVVEADYLGKKLILLTRLVSFFGSLTMMLITSPLLTLAAIVVMLIPTAVSILTSTRLVGAEKNVSERNSDFVTAVSDCLNGFKVIKSFKAEKEVLNIFSNDNKRLEDEKYRRERIKTIIAACGGLAGALAQFGVFIAGTLMCLKGWGVTPGVVIMFVNLMNFLIQPVSELPTLLSARKASLALIDKLAAALEKNSEIDEGEDISSFKRSMRQI